MLIKKLDLSKKQTDALVAATGAVILALILIIGMMVANSRNESTDISFLGHGFKVQEEDVLIKTPRDEWIPVQIDDTSHHTLEILSGNINKAYNKWHSVLRNGTIFLYLLFFLLIMVKKRDSYFHGLFNGFLAGAALLLLFVILQGLLEVNSLLVSFSHDFTHLIF
jgi:hypothetical protein